LAQADILLNQVYDNLNLGDNTSEEKYNQINDIISGLAEINNEHTIHPKTTGTISERLCELALQARVPTFYKRITGEWNWMADFSVLGHPFNLLVSVKSFKAKERLLVSGSGNILSPTVGWGLFDDAGEWTEDRTRLYLFRSFIAIYLPTSLYDEIPAESKLIHNINGKMLLRRIDNFMNDLSAAIIANENVINILAF